MKKGRIRRKIRELVESKKEKFKFEKDKIMDFLKTQGGKIKSFLNDEKTRAFLDAVKAAYLYIGASSKESEEKIKQQFYDAVKRIQELKETRKFNEYARPFLEQWTREQRDEK